MIGIEWGVPICSPAHKKETPHDEGRFPPAKEKILPRLDFIMKQQETSA